jgi:hypothetical protein
MLGGRTLKLPPIFYFGVPSMTPPMQTAIDGYIDEYTKKDPHMLMAMIAAQQRFNQEQVVEWRDSIDKKYDTIQSDITEIKKCGQETKDSVWKHQVIIDSHESRIKEQDKVIAEIKSAPKVNQIRNSIWASLPITNKILLIMIVGLIATAIGIKLDPSFIGNFISLFGL